MKTKTSISSIAVLGLMAITAASLSACGKQDGGSEATPPSAQTMPNQDSMAAEGSPGEKDSMKGMPMEEGAASDAGMHSAKGTIQRIDQTAGTVKIAHGPVASMKWPAMTMDFKVENAAALGMLKEGEQVDFSFTEQAPGQYTISEISARH